jgi:hypothetical protein
MRFGDVEKWFRFRQGWGVAWRLRGLP